MTVHSLLFLSFWQNIVLAYQADTIRQNQKLIEENDARLRVELERLGLTTEERRPEVSEWQPIEMGEREKIVKLIAQTLAPRLFKLYGVAPEEMGFPIYDTREEVDEHLARQFDPVGYWTDIGREIAGAIVNILEAGGITVTGDVDAMCIAALKERPDIIPVSPPPHGDSRGEGNG